MRSCHGSKPEERIGVDDDGKREGLEEPGDERVGLGASPEPRSDRDGIGSLGLGQDRRRSVGPVEASVGHPMIQQSQVVNDVAAANDQHTSLAKPD